jgi:hypothetical protein
MKKSLIALALLVTTSAFAGGTGFIAYDYDHANKGQGPLEYQHAVKTGVAFDTGLGTVDLAAIGRQLNSPARDNNLGVEVGYGIKHKYQGVTLGARAAWARVNLVDTHNRTFRGRSEYYTLGAELAAPVSKDVGAFVGYTFLKPLNGGTPQSNRTTLGVDLALTSAMSARLGYAYTVQDGQKLNGITTAVSYAF